MKTLNQRSVQRKVTFILCALLLGATVCFAGCGGEKSGGDTEKSSAAASDAVVNTGDSEKKEPAFPAVATLKGVSMIMGEDAAPVLAALGEAKNYVAKESCAFVGQDKEYTYDGFVIMTYPDGDVDRISTVVLTSDAVTTGEGLYIGAEESAIEKALGSDCKKESGSYLYKSESAQLLILAEGGRITSIQYSAVLAS